MGSFSTIETPLESPPYGGFLCFQLLLIRVSMLSIMSKFIAKKRLKSALRNHNYDEAKAVLDWGCKALVKCEFYQWFVVGIERYPFQDAQWFRDNFPIYFERPNGDRWVFM